MLFSLLFVVLQIALVAFLLIMIVHACHSLVGGFGFGPYVPSSKEAMREMMELADIKSGMTTLELGSGDGRVTVEAVKRGAKGIGIERDFALVWASRLRARFFGVSAAATFVRGDVWKVPFPKETDVVFLYALPRAMDKIWERLRGELRPGTLVISNAFLFPDKPPVASLRKSRAYRLD